MLGPLRSRVETRLRELERTDPDGTVATWRWMWRALTRSSRSPWRLRLRFTAMVLWDAALLAGWWAFRAPLRRARRAPARTIGLTAGIVAATTLFWVNSLDYTPWTSAANIRLQGDAIELSGQRVSLDDLRQVAATGEIGVANIRVSPEVTVRQLMNVQDALAAGSAGPDRVRILHAWRSSRLR